MTIRGYLVEVQWDGATLTAEGTNKIGQVALRGESRKGGPVVLPRESITAAEFKDASRMVNGNLTVHAGDEKYELHFRRKQADDFRQLASELGAV